MHLKSYIDKLGVAEVARRVDVVPSAVSNWRQGIRQPSRENARKLIETSAGELSWSDIFGSVSGQVAA